MTEQNHIKIDVFQKTTVPGTFACGDNATRMRSIANAVTSGGMTGVITNIEMMDEEF